MHHCQPPPLSYTREPVSLFFLPNLSESSRPYYCSHSWSNIGLEIPLHRVPKAMWGNFQSPLVHSGFYFLITPTAPLNSGNPCSTDQECQNRLEMPGHCNDIQAISTAYKLVTCPKPSLVALSKDYCRSTEWFGLEGTFSGHLAWTLLQWAGTAAVDQVAESPIQPGMGIHHLSVHVSPFSL